MKQVIAIYDRDAEYSNRLAQYLGEVKKIPFRMVCFTKEEALLNFAKEQFIEILIVNEQIVTERIKALCIKKQIIVTEERLDVHCHAWKEEEGTNRLYKYQSVEGIAQRLSMFIEKNDVKVDDIWNHKVRVIGIYPCITGDSAFSIALAQVLSREQRVFYCDLGSFSCVNELMGVLSETDLSDAIYYMHQGILKERLGDVVQNYRNIDFISPVRCPEDLRIISAEDIKQLLQHIVEIKECTIVVLPLGECIYMPVDMLSICHSIYIPIKNDLESELKQAKFIKYLEDNGMDRVRDKIQFVTLPSYREIGAGVPYVEQVLWNEMGDFVRTLL